MELYWESDFKIRVWGSGDEEEKIIKYAVIAITVFIVAAIIGMAAKYPANLETIKGIVLYAAYPQGNELENTKISVLSIFGSEDGVDDLDKVKGAALSNASKMVEIPGGNHCYF